MLVVTKVTEAGVPREQNILVEKRDVDFSFTHKMETRRETDTMLVPHDQILNTRTLIA